jgi:hypothetical protein
MQTVAVVGATARAVTAKTAVTSRERVAREDHRGETVLASKVASNRIVGEGASA